MSNQPMMPPRSATPSQCPRADDGEVPAEAMIAVVDGDGGGYEAQPKNRAGDRPVPERDLTCSQVADGAGKIHAMISSATNEATKGTALGFILLGSMPEASIQGLLRVV